MGGNNQSRHTERVRHNRDEDSGSDSVCFYNNRHLEYSECKVAGSLRTSGGEFGGAARTSLSAIGFDSYNLLVTDGLAITLQASRADDHHLPVVFIRRNNER